MNFRKKYFDLFLAKLYFARHLKEKEMHLHQYIFTCNINPIPVIAKMPIAHGKNLDDFLSKRKNNTYCEY